MKRNAANTPVVIAAVVTVLILIAVLVTCSRGDTDCDGAPAVTTLEEAALVSVVDSTTGGGKGGKSSGKKSSGKKSSGKKPGPAKSKKPGRAVVGVTAGVGMHHDDDDCDD